VRRDNQHSPRLWLLLALAPLIAGCSGASDMLSRDAEWFSRPGRPGGPAEAQALTDGPAGAPQAAPMGGSVALGHTECDVVRGIGAPDSVNLSANPRGERQAVVTWSRGPRAGIYTFNAGRLSSVERGPEPIAQPKAAKPKTKKKAAT
jgi:hypothetical protein